MYNGISIQVFIQFSSTLNVLYEFVCQSHMHKCKLIKLQIMYSQSSCTFLYLVHLRIFMVSLPTAIEVWLLFFVLKLLILFRQIILCKRHTSCTLDTFLLKWQLFGDKYLNQWLSLYDWSWLWLLTVKSSVIISVFWPHRVNYRYCFVATVWKTV